jgi:undecaprenyl pyrophosphate phosphatase UppP
MNVRDLPGAPACGPTLLSVYPERNRLSLIQKRHSYKSKAQLAGGNMLIIAIGFAASFICGWFVVKTLLGYVSRHGFALFAWWRIVVGALGLIALALGL